jgi:hypothetical protein
MELSKGDFAALIKVSAGRVSQYIAEGKLTGAALVGEGPRAKINVPIALSQLGKSLDPVQLSAQQRPALPLEQAAAVTPTTSGPATVPIDGDQARFNRARADKQEIEAEQARRSLDEERGRYVLAEAAQREWTRQTAALIQAQHEWHRDVALILGSELGADPKLVATILRREFRSFCQKRSDLALAALAQIEPFAADPALSTDTGNS